MSNDRMTKLAVPPAGLRHLAFFIHLAFVI
jgi:hypothetical protein